MTSQAAYTRDEIIAAFREGGDAASTVIHRLVTDLTYAGVNEKWGHHRAVEAWFDEHGLAFPADEHGDLACAHCGDGSDNLSDRGWCEHCEESFIPEAEQCDECRERATNFWPELKKPVQLCASCTHNAFRSGWTPGQ